MGRILIVSSVAFRKIGTGFMAENPPMRHQPKHRNPRIDQRGDSWLNERQPDPAGIAKSGERALPVPVEGALQRRVRAVGADDYALDYGATLLNH